jgi:dihydropteroate synthase
LTDLNNTYVHTYAGRSFDYAKHTYIMGILNVTPDSFSDGGKFFSADRAVEHAILLAEQGADMLDIGGESTRPGSVRISAEEELNRVLPVIEGIRRHSDIVLSIDTYKADVARQAIEAGVQIVNDISALRFDSGMIDVIRAGGASVILMHMKGSPETMQLDPFYDDVVSEVGTFLTERAEYAVRAGIQQILLDPGIGFGKRFEDNIALLRSLKEFTGFGFPLAIGVSRKSFIGTILDLPVDRRQVGTITATVLAMVNGARLVRVHDVGDIKKAVLVYQAVQTGSVQESLHK